MEEARYVKVASRFFLAVGQGMNAAGDGCGGDNRRHFLDACFLCKRADITSDRHIIFMYKGDAAFCSDDCRQEQRGVDAALKATRRRHRLLRRTAAGVVVVGRRVHRQQGRHFWKPEYRCR